MRWVCAMGDEPAGVIDFRHSGIPSPDASDSCVNALIRTAHDHKLPDFYKELLTELKFPVEGYEKLPHLIGGVVLSGGKEVSLGGGNGLHVTSPIAFDAGFATAYLEGASRREGVDAQQLKKVTESCLAKGEDPKTCFSVGYVFGAEALSAAR
jgi:hypothetical protein